ncbi:DUF1579 domain-containing protein [Melioribacter sp. OK-6-Me]|uniref:DUF1579 domain-containing protein n=1 Tax=unclassified Melioribacter TaxID=2627329 RepID=UPI003ED97110
MKKLISFLSIIVFLSGVSYGQDDPAAMEAWMKYMTPGPMHEMLSSMAGDWKTVMTMKGQGGQEMKSEGTAKFEMIMGGRYLKSTFHSDMMGMAMEGIGIDAYDNAKKEFISIWIDNMGTGVTVLNGKFDETTKTITYYGTTVDPATGKDSKIKSVTKIIDDDNHKFEMYNVLPDGSEALMFDMDYIRIK